MISKHKNSILFYIIFFSFATTLDNVHCLLTNKTGHRRNNATKRGGFVPPQNVVYRKGKNLIKLFLWQQGAHHTLRMRGDQGCLP